MGKLLKKYDKILEKIYYDVKNPNSYGSVKNLYNSAKIINPNIKLNYVKYWLKNQNTYTLHKISNKRFKRNPMISRYIDQWWQSDLADMSLLSKFNRGVKYLLVIIDVLSKFGWIVPLLNKKPESIINGLEKIIKSSKRKPIYLYTDAGREYVNSKLQKLLNENNIKHVIARNTETKSAIAERWIRTIKQKIYKFMTAKNTKTYINKLDNIVDSYNRTVHSRTKFKPFDVNKSNEKLVFRNLYKGLDSKSNKILKTNTPVRLQKIKRTFEKGYESNWTKEIFLIDKILNTKPFPRFTVKDTRGEVLDGSFYEKELQSIVN